MGGSFYNEPLAPGDSPTMISIESRHSQLRRASGRPPLFHSNGWVGMEQLGSLGWKPSAFVTPLAVHPIAVLKNTPEYHCAASLATAGFLRQLSLAEIRAEWPGDSTISGAEIAVTISRRAATSPMPSLPHHWPLEDPAVRLLRSAWLLPDIGAILLPRLVYHYDGNRNVHVTVNNDVPLFPRMMANLCNAADSVGSESDSKMSNNRRGSSLKNPFADASTGAARSIGSDLDPELETSRGARLPTALFSPPSLAEALNRGSRLMHLLAHGVE